MNFVEAMAAAQAGFDAWAAKPHNAKWFKRIDGTPIPNDLLVNIAVSVAGIDDRKRIEIISAIDPENPTELQESVRVANQITANLQDEYDSLIEYTKSLENRNWWQRLINRGVERP